MSRPRPTSPLRLIETYAPDPERCVRALLRLLAWEDHSPTPQEEDGAGTLHAASRGGGVPTAGARTAPETTRPPTP